jgi:ribosome biogenesis protein YTM1
MERTIEVSFITKLENFRVTETPFRLPIELARYGLSEVINHLLSLEPHKLFDFLIDNQFLRTSLKQYLEEKNLTEEVPIVIEYVESNVLPEPSKELIHDDWVSSIDSTMQGIYLTGCYDNVARLWNSSGKKIMDFAGGHTKSIKDVALLQLKSEKQKIKAVRFVTASQDHTLKVWKANLNHKKSSIQFECVGHNGTVECVDVNLTTPTKFCSGSWDSTISIWDLNSEPIENLTNESTKKKRKIRSHEPKQFHPSCSLIGHNGSISRVKWISVNRIISGSYDHSIRTWDVEAQINVSSLFGSSIIHGMSYCPQSNLIATGHNDNLIRFWDFRTQDSVVWKSLTSHNGWIPSVSFHPQNENLLVSGSYDKTVKFWDIRSKIPLHTLTGHTDKVLTVSWDQEGKILSGGADNKLKTWVFP